MADRIKPYRQYIKIPTDKHREIETLAVQHDVPIESVTRLLLGLGMACLRQQPSTKAVQVLMQEAGVSNA